MRRNAIFSLLALIIFLIPGLVQDIHRVYGHQPESEELCNHNCCGNHDYSSGHGFSNQSEDCPICIFEFNLLDEPSDFVYKTVAPKVLLSLTTGLIDQFQNHLFQYYNLRGPPIW